MSKFCNQCGAALDEEAFFCANCSATVSSSKKELPSPKKVMIIGGSVVLISIMIIVFCLLYGGIGSTYESAVDNCIQIMTGIGEKDYIEKTAPAKYWEYIEEEYGLTLEVLSRGYPDLASRWEVYLASMEEELGRNIQITHEITDAEKLDEDDLKDLAKDIKALCGISKKDVTAAYELEIELILKGEDDDYSIEKEAIAVQIDHFWYLWDDHAFVCAEELVYHNTHVYEYAINDYIQVISGKANEALLRNIAPDKYWEDTECERYISLEKVINNYPSYVQDTQDNLSSLGKNVRLSYEMLSLSVPEPDTTQELTEYLSRKYTISQDEILPTHRIDLMFHYEGSKDTYSWHTVFFAVQIYGHWYLWINGDFYPASNLVYFNTTPH